MPTTDADFDLKPSSHPAVPAIWDYTFANANNLKRCTKYLNQTLKTFGFAASLDLFANDPVSVARTCNCIYSLLQQQQRDMEFRQSTNERHQWLLSEVARLEAEVERLESRLQANDAEIAAAKTTTTTTTRMLKYYEAENEAAVKALDEKLKHERDDFQYRVTNNQNKLEWIEGDDDGSLDKLFLAQSDLSRLLRQIDELVVQAIKFKASGKQRRKEVEYFGSLLSDMLSSLKPWAPRFQSLFSSPSNEAGTQVGQCMVSQTCSQAKEDETFEVESPEQTKFESLISPSPLVAWRGDFNVGKGRQLFMLTPLAASKNWKHQKLPALNFENITSNTMQLAHIPRDADNGLGRGGEGKTTISKPPGFVAGAPKSIPENDVNSVPIFQKENRSELLMTPCLKMSPPKSCVLLDPPTQSCSGGKRRIHKSTPFPLGIRFDSDSEDPESSGRETSNDLALKYPELRGIQWASGIMKKDFESSPDWLCSPPKTCVLLELPDEKSVDENCADHMLTTACAFKEQNNKPESEAEDTKTGVVGGCLAGVENTPLVKAESILRTGKRAGENTLKRDLWTKFEAATTQGFRYNIGAPQGTTEKGFLDMLEEVSCEKENLATHGLR